MTTPLDIALAYVARAWNPVPVAFKDKKPTAGKGWQHLRINAENAPQHFNGARQNIGVQLGTASGNLRDVDLDCQEAIAAAPYLLPPTGAIFGRASARNSHYLYVADDFAEAIDVATLNFDDPAPSPDRKARLCELRVGGGAKGAQTVFPGSTHEEGEAIDWEVAGEPQRVDGTHLLRCVGRVASAALLARHWPNHGKRHDTRLAIGGVLARAGWSEQDAKLFAEAVAHAVGDEDTTDFKKAIGTSFAGFVAGKPTTGIPKFADIFGDAVTRVIKDWLHLDTTEYDTPRALLDPKPKCSTATPAPSTFAALPVFDPWEKYIVPAFPFGILPEDVATWVETQALSIGCDPTGLAWCAIANFSAAIDHRFRLKMMRSGTFEAHPRLWTLLVGDPSYKKSPMQNAAMAALETAQNRLRDQFESERETYLEGGGDPKNGPVPPPRYIIGDATTEKLGELLSRHDRGTLVHRDELAGWIGAMDRYNGSNKGGASADRAFWLKAFDGGTFTVDRVMRGEMRIRNLSASVLGGIQPERLAELRGLTSDGLLQRFIPVMLASPMFGEDVETGDAEFSYTRLTLECLSLQPQIIRMTDDAREAMRVLRKYIFDLELSAKGVASGFQGFVGKLSGLSGSLALILHLIESPRANVNAPISMQTIEAVSRLVRDCVLPHAFEFYRTAESVTNGDRLQRVASWILTSGKQRILASDLTSEVRSFRGLSLPEVNEQLSPLVAGGWISPEKAGPVANAWVVNPIVASQFVARAEEEERRKQAIAHLMNSPRKPRSA